MIEDLEGATSEPTRRPHVLALSGAIAAVSLALLVVLVPRSVLTIASGSTSIGSDPALGLHDDSTSTECAAGIGSNPPVHLVLDRSGR